MSIFPRLFAAAVALAAGILIATPASASPEQPTLPVIHAEMLDGSPWSLKDNRGAITLVSFWSPDSLASRKCIAELQRFADDYRARGVKVVAVAAVNAANTADAADAVKDVPTLRSFVTKRKLTLPVAMLGEHNLGELPERMMPIVHVYDRDGKLVAARAGLFSYRILEVLAVPPLMKPASTATQ